MTHLALIPRLPLLLVLLATAAQAHVALRVQVLEGDPTRRAGEVVIAIQADNPTPNTIASYALRLWLADGVRYVANSIADGGAGFGGAPLLNDLGSELRISAVNSDSRLGSGRLCTLTFDVARPLDHEPLLLLEGYGPDSLLTDSYNRLTYWFDLTELTLPKGDGPGKTPALPGETPTPAPPTPAPTRPGDDHPNAIAALQADVNGDCRVDVVDITLILDAMGNLNPWTGEGPGPDVNQDGAVNIFDLTDALASIGKTPLGCVTPDQPQHDAHLTLHQGQPDAAGLFEVVIEAVQPLPLRGFQVSLAFDPARVTFLDGDSESALDPHGDQLALSHVVERDGMLHTLATRMDGTSVLVQGTLVYLVMRATHGDPGRLTLADTTLLQPTAPPIAAAQLQ